MLNNKKILITGVTRNGGAKLTQEINTLRTAFGNSKEIYFLIIESDSEDATVEILSSLATHDEKFQYISLGRLEESIKLRTERIAYCRNFYLEKIRSDPVYKDIDFVAVVDLDGVNNHLRKEAVNSCFARADWSVCTANQSGNYYDLWALRHPIWSPVDCWGQYRFLSQYTDISDLQKKTDLIFITVHSKMIHLPQDSPWIEVNSAFGGLAIYKKECLLEGLYVGMTQEGLETCEHVSLHASISQRGHKIFINPRLINTDFTEHSKMFKPVKSILLYT